MSFNDFFDEQKFDFEAERKKFIDNLDYLKSMSVQEQTLYKKWQEFMAPFFEIPEGAAPDESMIEIEEVFHLD